MVKFEHWFRRQCVEMSDLYSLYRMVTLEILSRSLKPNQFFPPPKIASLRVWSKSIHWFRRQRRKTLFEHFNVPV